MPPKPPKPAEVPYDTNDASFITFRTVLEGILKIPFNGYTFQTLLSHGIIGLEHLLTLTKSDLTKMGLNTGTIHLIEQFIMYVSETMDTDEELNWDTLSSTSFIAFRRRFIFANIRKASPSRSVGSGLSVASPRSTADPTRKPTVISTRKTSTKPSVVKSSENTGDTLTENIQVDPTVEEPVLPSSESEIKINCNTVGTIDENPVLPLLDYDFQLPIIGDIDDKQTEPSTVPTSHPTTKPTEDLMVMPTTEHMVKPTVKPTVNPTAKPTLICETIRK